MRRETDGSRAHAVHFHRAPQRLSAGCRLETVSQAQCHGQAQNGTPVVPLLGTETDTFAIDCITNFRGHSLLLFTCFRTFDRIENIFCAQKCFLSIYSQFLALCLIPPHNL
uniref:Uncharacterized protein n=1 Tax=Gasterosteus aculeatus TaxID=69293 RepID=G3PB89_GASAC